MDHPQGPIRQLAQRCFVHVWVKLHAKKGEEDAGKLGQYLLKIPKSGMNYLNSKDAESEGDLVHSFRA
jgi:hypothetical protein